MDRRQILDYLRTQHLAVEASVAATGAPQAAVVGVAFTDELEVIFDTLRATRKYLNLIANPKIAFVIGGLDEGDERSVQWEGVADFPGGAELERLKAVYFAAHPDGPTRAAWPGLVYVRARPKWLRFSDYDVDPPKIVELRF